jgi:DNA-binding protein
MESKQGGEVTKQPRENPNIINVSGKRNQNFYVFLGKQLLKEHDWIEFQALGNAVSTAVMSAENLVRYKLSI